MIMPLVELNAVKKVVVAFVLIDAKQSTASWRLPPNERTLCPKLFLR